MPRLPSSANVPQVQQRSDPGVRVSGPSPVQAFETPVGQAAEEFAPAFGRLAEAAQRQQTREATIDIADKVIKYNQASAETFRKFNTERDLSQPETLAAFGEALETQAQELLAEHRRIGTPESLARAEIRLRQVQAEFVGNASAAAATIGLSKAQTFFDGQLAPIAAEVSSNPTRESINAALDKVNVLVADVAPGIDPTQEQKLRQAGENQVAFSAINALTARGRVEEAEAMLEDQGLATILTPQQLRQTRDRIEATRAKKSALTDQIAAIEAARGAPLSRAQLDQVLGVAVSTNEKLVEVFDPQSPTGVTFVPQSQAVGRAAPSKDGSTERDRRRARLEARGFSPELADDIASGDVSVQGPDQFGGFFAINAATGQKRPIEGADARVAAEAVAQASGQGAAPGGASPAQTFPLPDQSAGPEPQRRTLEDDVAQATGPFSNVQAGISNVLGSFVDGALFPDTTEARQRVRTVTQFMKAAFINNPRAPVAEQNIVKQFLPDVDKFFTDPDATRGEVRQLRDGLQLIQQGKMREFESAKITEDRRGELANEISRINEALRMMGDDPDAAAGAPAPAGPPTAVNPQTGERVQFNQETGQWEPAP